MCASRFATHSAQSIGVDDHPFVQWNEKRGRPNALQKVHLFLLQSFQEIKQ